MRAMAPQSWTRLHYWAYGLLGAKVVMFAVAGLSSFVHELPGIPEVSTGSFALVACFLGSSVLLLAGGYWIGALSAACYAAATISGAVASTQSEGISVWSTISGVTGLALLVVTLPLVVTPNPNRTRGANRQEVSRVSSDV